MKEANWLLLITLFLFTACEFKLRPNEEETAKHRIEVCRYDRLQSQYLTTGDFSALQQMNTDYPIETRTLIENVLKIGEVYDPQINRKFLSFYQDSVLQTIISDAESQFADMEDINKHFNVAFDNLLKYIPSISVPLIYAQIGALDQSVVIGNHSIGISLDKYLGEDYPIYKKYYPQSQIKTMRREHIVPDCMSFYLLSLYPLPEFESRSQIERDVHVGKIMWVCNLIFEKPFFKTKYVTLVDKYMSSNKQVKIESLLIDNDYTKIINRH
ncbi:MAG: gliding motility protein GldB [Prevotella sp.]